MIIFISSDCGTVSRLTLSLTQPLLPVEPFCYYCFVWSSFQKKFYLTRSSVIAVARSSLGLYISLLIPGSDYSQLVFQICQHFVTILLLFHYKVQAVFMHKHRRGLECL